MFRLIGTRPPFFKRLEKQGSTRGIFWDSIGRVAKTLKYPAKQILAVLQFCPAYLTIASIITDNYKNFLKFV